MAARLRRRRTTQTPATIMMTTRAAPETDNAIVKVWLEDGHKDAQLHVSDGRTAWLQFLQEQESKKIIHKIQNNKLTNYRQLLPHVSHNNNERNSKCRLRNYIGSYR
jgi:hypothetical protein